LCPNFIIFWPKGRHLIYNSISLPNLSIIFPNFLHNTLYMTLTTPSLNYKHPLMCVHTSHRPYGYPPLTLCSWQQTHWNPWCNVLHFCCHCARCVFPRGMRTIVCASFDHIQQVNIVLTKDGICTLANIIIINPMRTDLLPQSCAIQGFTTSYVTQTKEKSYCNRHPTDQFLPLTIEIFGYLHKYANVFLQDCANAIWSLKRLKGPSCLYLSHFSLSKSFDHITKDANILHLKSNNSHRLNYFPTSTLSRHTSHHHGQSILGHQFLT
jgi:hypothetical protein